MGIGRMWSPKTGWGNANDVLEQNELSLIEYKPKEVRYNHHILGRCGHTFFRTRTREKEYSYPGPGLEMPATPYHILFFNVNMCRD